MSDRLAALAFVLTANYRAYMDGGVYVEDAKIDGDTLVVRFTDGSVMRLEVKNG